MTKVLFISNFSTPDYLADSVYTGLNKLENVEIYTYACPTHLIKGIGYNDNNILCNRYTNKKQVPAFFYSNKIENPPFVEQPNHVISSIKEKKYDIILYGNCFRDLLHFDLVEQHYPKEKIIVLDGEDYAIYKEDIANKSTYYKREITNDSFLAHVKPISFGVPDDLLLNQMPLKLRPLAKVIPGDFSTYVYRDEKTYFKDYQRSFFGKTTKKGGWDCARHYEILANRCIPYFPDLKYCPKYIMVDFPKELILYTNKYSHFKSIPPDYNLINYQIYEHTKKKLLCTVIAKKLLHNSL